jgi:hypothetical protein
MQSDRGAVVYLLLLKCVENGLAQLLATLEWRGVPVRQGGVKPAGPHHVSTKSVTRNCPRACSIFFMLKRGLRVLVEMEGYDQLFPHLETMMSFLVMSCVLRKPCITSSTMVSRFTRRLGDSHTCDPHHTTLGTEPKEVTDDDATREGYGSTRDH